MSSCFKHIRCPEELETGKCSLRNTCPYFHRDAYSSVTMASLESKLHASNTTSFDPSKVVEEYDPCNPSGKIETTTFKRESTLKTYTPSSSPPKSSFIGQPTYIMPNDRKPKLPIQRIANERKTVAKPNKPVDRGALLSRVVNINRRTIKKPEPKNVTKPVIKEKPKKEDILDQIPKSEMPVIKWQSNAHLSVAQRRPMLEHFLRLYLQYLKPEETYKDAIPKALKTENEVCCSCSTFLSYKGMCGQKYIDLKEELEKEKNPTE
mmetsp:Transcript_38032/g.65234  ORF Transcript_38032/g.65234 Transcript_38032/m.65234 type:complete len:264 (-) Transcript_38032:39-830(-)